MLFDIYSMIQDLRYEPWAGGELLHGSFLRELADWIGKNLVPNVMEQLVDKVDEIVEIDPALSEREIFEAAARHLVDFLHARSVSVRIYDPHTRQMLSYGSFPSEEERRQIYIPIENSIAGEVVSSGKTVLAPDLVEDVRYKDKGAIDRKGVYSLMAVPLEIPRFFPMERDTVGVIQIYYSQRNRAFHPMEIQTANTMAKRLSFALARKKILFLYQSSEKKETLVRNIFRKLGKRGGIKMHEVFDLIVPELAEMVSLQACALFSVTRDMAQVILEAGFPRTGGYHSVGKAFTVSSQPVFEILLNLRQYRGESIYEVVTPFYILVVDPQRSDLISPSLKNMALIHNINSILYIPLGSEDEVTHILTFDAIEKRLRYRDDEIDLLLFMGRELMKAQKMERLDDALHDFKNPAIATAGFARRLMALIDSGKTDSHQDQLRRYANIILEETTRLQELAMGMFKVGGVEKLNLTEVLQKRFAINREVIREQLRIGIQLEEGPFDADLFTLAYPVQVERVFDNLLSNATKAVPIRGGALSIKTYAQGPYACAEISNTGPISEENRMKILSGEGEGRGLYIIQRIMTLLKGKVELRVDGDTTTFVLRFPRLEAGGETSTPQPNDEGLPV